MESGGDEWLPSPFFRVARTEEGLFRSGANDAVIVGMLPGLALAALIASADTSGHAPRATPFANAVLAVAAPPLVPPAPAGTAVPAPVLLAANGGRRAGPALLASAWRDTSARLDSVVVLPEFRVDRDRVRPMSERRAPTSWITTLPAHRSGRALETLPEVLATAPGVHITQYGGLGSFSTVSLRGAPANQVAVYLDGMPLGGPGRPVVDLSGVPYAAIDHADVYLGGSPLSLGAAPGGAIDLVSRRDLRGLELRGTGGAYGSWEGAATGGLVRGALHALLHVWGQGSRGDFRYLDDNGTPFNAADDSVHGRVNAGFTTLGAMAGLEWAPAGPWHARLREHLMLKTQGVPGLGSIPAGDTRLDRTSSLTQLAFTRDGRRAAPETELSGWLGRDQTRFEDTRAELGMGAHDTRDRLAVAGARARLAWERLPLGLMLDAAGELHRDRAALSDALDGRPDPAPSRRDALGGTAGLGWRGLGERLQLRAARRWDRLWDHLDANTAGGSFAASVTRTLEASQIGARARLGLGLEARANWSRARRAPDFLELFGNSGSVLGNAALVPETNESRDAGITWDSPGGSPLGASLGWTAFDSRLEDLILYVRNSASTVRAQNVSRARVRGHEGTLRLRAPRGFSATLAFTTQLAVDEGSVSYWRGKRLPEHPEQEGDARLDWRHGGWGAGASLSWLGDDFLDRYNRYRVASRRLVGATLRAPLLSSRTVLTLEGKNLTDDRASDVAGFPLPGRGFFVAFETRFGPAPASAP